MALAVLLSIPYLEGSGFDMRMDNDALQCIMNVMYSRGRLTGWRQRQLEIEFKVAHWAAIIHQPTDTSSCLLTTGMDEHQLKDHIMEFVIGHEQPKKGKIKTNTRYWASLSCNTVKNSLKPGLPELNKCPTEQTNNYGLPQAN